MKSIKIISILLLSCLVPAVQASTFTAAFDEDWFNVANWNTMIVPSLYDATYHSFLPDANCVISGTGSDAGSTKVRVPNRNILTIKDGASYSADDYLDIGFAADANSKLIVKNNARLSVRKLNVAASGAGAKAFAIFDNCSYVPFNYTNLDTNLFACRDDGTSLAVIDFNNAVLSAQNHDGTANRLILCLTVGAQSATATMNVNDSNITIGRYAAIGQSNRGILNMKSGTMYVGENLNIGNNSTDSRYRGYGELNMSGGTLTAKSGIWARTGKSGKLSIINMTGGLLKTPATLGLQLNSVGFFGGTSQIEAPTFKIDLVAAPSVQPVCKLFGSAKLLCTTLTISGGSLDINDLSSIVVNGDFRSQAAAYISSGAITGGGLMRKVLVSYDSGSNQTTLSMGTDEMLKKAYIPLPASGAQVLRQIGKLAWTSGNGAISHKLYISKSSIAIAGSNITPAYDGTATEYGLAGVIEPGTYYWRVDEFDGSTTTKGDTWQFTASGIEIDQFAYADTAALLAVWTQGAGATLSKVTDQEQASLVYNNSSSPYYSEITRVPPFANFTANGVKSLDVTVYGNGNNSNEPVFVTLSDGVNSATVVSQSDISSSNPSWQSMQIALSDFTAANSSLNLHNIQTIAIGLGNKNNPQAGGTGTVLFGDVILYESRCLDVPVNGDLNQDCRVDFKDFANIAEGWQQQGFWPAE